MPSAKRRCRRLAGRMGWIGALAAVVLLAAGVARAAPADAPEAAASPAAGAPEDAGPQREVPPAAAQETGGAEPAGGGAHWEVGIGLSVITYPDYVGSDQRQTWPLPFPYVVYESRRVKVEQGTVTGALPLTDRLRFDLSAGGALPVESDKNHARRGMDDLDATGEIGPSLKYDFYRAGSGRHTVTGELPLRATIGVAFDDIRYVGLISTPNIEYRYEQEVDDGRWNVRLSTGPMFTDGRYNNYFYGVPTRDALPDRPAYNADGGYGGWRTSAGFSRRWNDYWFGAFVRYINLDGAVFENSPLVKTRTYLIGGLGVAWIFAHSDD